MGTNIIIIDIIVIITVIVIVVVIVTCICSYCNCYFILNLMDLSCCPLECHHSSFKTLGIIQLVSYHLEIFFFLKHNLQALSM